MVQRPGNAARHEAASDERKAISKTNETNVESSLPFLVIHDGSVNDMRFNIT